MAGRVVGRHAPLLSAAVALICVATTWSQFLPDLPPEIQAKIVSELPRPDLIRAASVSKTWRAVLQQLLHRSIVMNLDKVTSDSDVARLVAMVNRMRADDRRRLGAAFDSLRPCPKTKLLARVVKALTRCSMSAAKAKSIIRLLRRIGIPSSVLAGVFLKKGVIVSHAVSSRRTKSLWKSFLASVPAGDPTRQQLSRVAAWPSIPDGTPFSEAESTMFESWSLADDDRRKFLILHGFDCNTLVPRLRPVDFGHLFRRFGFLPDARVMLLELSLEARVAVVDALVKYGAPVASVAAYLPFSDMIHSSCDTTLRYARRYHPFTHFDYLSQDLILLVLRKCPDQVSGELLPLIVTSNQFKGKPILQHAGYFDPLDLLRRLGRMFCPGTPLLNILVDYVGVAFLGRVYGGARLPLPAVYTTHQQVYALLCRHIESLPQGVSVADTDDSGRSSLHALGDAIAITGWKPIYGNILLKLSMRTGASASPDLFAKRDHRSQTFLDIVSGNLTSLAHCIKMLAKYASTVFSKVALPANVNGRGETILHYPGFYKSGVLPPAEFVLSRPELLDVLDNEGRSVLHVAVSRSCYRAVEWYLTARPGLLFVCDGAGRSILHNIGPVDDANAVSATDVMALQFVTIPMVAAIGAVPVDSTVAKRLLLIRDRNGQTAMDVALSESSAPHHKAKHSNRQNVLPPADPVVCVSGGHLRLVSLFRSPVP